MILKNLQLYIQRLYVNQTLYISTVLSLFPLYSPLGCIHCTTLTGYKHTHIQPAGNEMRPAYTRRREREREKLYGYMCCCCCILSHGAIYSYTLPEATRHVPGSRYRLASYICINLRRARQR